MAKDPRENMRRQALESLKMAQQSADRMRRDWQTLSDSWFAIGKQVLKKGKYPPGRALADSFALSLQAYSLMTAWWMPPRAPDAEAESEKEAEPPSEPPPPARKQP
jgi:hypothetical protein